MDKIPPAATVTNIKSSIPVMLEHDTSKYNSWKQLFITHCKAYEAIEHIIPPAVATAKPPTWDRVDSIVLTWIYATISTDLLETILKPDVTAKDAWDTLAKLFEDNENSRTVDLENKFSSTRLDSFPDISSYCKALKNIADQLANVKSPVSDKRLVLQVIKGLNSKFSTVAAIIQQTNPLPDFFGARSQLIMEETRLLDQTQPVTEAALVAATAASTVQTTARQQPSQQSAFTDFEHQNRTPAESNQRGRGRGGRFRGRGRSRGRGGFHQQWYPMHYPPWQGSPHWATPPVPYPTQPMQRGGRGRGNPQFAGILGALPPYTDSYSPTNLAQAFAGMQLNPDQNWYLDSGATSHMTHNPGFPDADTYPPM